MKTIRLVVDVPEDFEIGAHYVQIRTRRYGTDVERDFSFRYLRDEDDGQPAAQGDSYSLGDIDKAFEATIQRVSTTLYNSNEICRHFFGEFKKLLTTPPTAQPAHTADSEPVAWRTHEMGRGWRECHKDFYDLVSRNPSQFPNRKVQELFASPQPVAMVEPTAMQRLQDVYALGYSASATMYSRYNNGEKDAVTKAGYLAKMVKDLAPYINHAEVVVLTEDQKIEIIDREIKAGPQQTGLYLRIAGSIEKAVRDANRVNCYRSVAQPLPAPTQQEAVAYMHKTTGAVLLADNIELVRKRSDAWLPLIVTPHNPRKNNNDNDV